MAMHEYKQSKVGVYLRVSTLDQESGVASQKHAVQQYLTGHGLEDVRWFKDRLSGKDTNRPAFQKLQRAIFGGQVNTVVVWKLDRLSRSLRDGIAVLCDWIEKDIRVISVSQQLDFSGATGQLIASVLFSVAQMERENLRENTKRGLAAAKARGVKLGRPLSVNPQGVVNLLQQGHSMAAISRRLGRTRPTIYSALERAGIDISEVRA